MDRNDKTHIHLPPIGRKESKKGQEKERVVMLDKGVDHYVTCCPQLHHEVQTLTHSVLGLEAKIDLLLRRVGRLESIVSSK